MLRYKVYKNKERDNISECFKFTPASAKVGMVQWTLLKNLV